MKNSRAKPASEIARERTSYLFWDLRTDENVASLPFRASSLAAAISPPLSPPSPTLILILPPVRREERTSSEVLSFRSLFVSPSVPLSRSPFLFLRPSFSCMIDRLASYRVYIVATSLIATINPRAEPRRSLRCRFPAKSKSLILRVDA